MNRSLSGLLLERAFIGNTDVLPSSFYHVQVFLKTYYSFGEQSRTRLKLLSLVQLSFFGIGMKTDIFQSCGHCQPTPNAISLCIFILTTFQVFTHFIHLQKYIVLFCVHFSSLCEHHTNCNLPSLLNNTSQREFPGGPLVKNLPSDARDSVWFDP